MCLNCHFCSMKWLIIVIRLFLLLSRSQSKGYHPILNCINLLLGQVSCSRTQHDEPGCGLELGPLLVYLEPSALTMMTLLIISKAMHKHLNCQLITPVSYVMFQLSIFSISCCYDGSAWHLTDSMREIRLTYTIKFYV